MRKGSRSLQLNVAVALLVLATARPGAAADCDDLSTAPNWSKCRTAVAAALSARTAAQIRGFSAADRVTAKIALRRAYRNWWDLNRWAKSVYSTKADREAARLALEDLHRDLRSQMVAAGIAEPVAGMLDIGYTLTTSGNGRIPMATDSSFENKAKGLLRWESQHRPVSPAHAASVSIGGDFGFAPVLVLWRPSANTSDPIATKDLSVLHQDAFVWGLTPRLNGRIGTSGEISLVGRAGQTILTSDVYSFKRGETDVTLDRVRSREGKAASLLEIGGEYRLFAGSLANGAAEDPANYLSPRLSFGGGYRRDGRFAGLQGVKDFGGAQDRWYFRAEVNLVKVLRNEKDEHPFSVKFAVENEQPARRGTVPQGTKIVISSDIDILKLLSGNGDK